MLTVLAASLLLINGSSDECMQLAQRVESLTAQVKQLVEAENASLRSQIELASVAQLDASAILEKLAERSRGFDSYADEGEITIEIDGRKSPREFRLHAAEAHGFRFEGKA